VHTLLILTRHSDSYRRLIEDARLPELAIVADRDRSADVDVVLGEPSLIRQALPALPSLRWVQSTWAGVEPLLDPSLRRDYTLTNARGVFGGLMSEYVFGYLIAHEPNGQWGWGLRTVQAGNASAWENPGGGFGICPTWGIMQTCIGLTGVPDLLFTIYGFHTFAE
jgi:hypothetical protein